MEEYLKGLNLPQFEAVTTTEGYVRVVAGAGSGKTRALVSRFAYLVREMGILPSNILCVTFTNKAAGEMKRRISNLTGDNDTGYINTFHGFCVSILQEDSYAVQYPKSFLVLDNSDIDDLLRIIYEERGLTMKDMTFKDARDMFEIRKCITEPGYYLDMITLSLDELKQKYENATDARECIVESSGDIADAVALTSLDWDSPKRHCAFHSEHVDYSVLEQMRFTDIPDAAERGCAFGFLHLDISDG